MVEFLNNKFKDHSSPNYVIKNIDGKQLEDDRSALKLKSFQTIEGSSKFQTMIFNPNSDYLKAAPRMCFCENCQTEYGSCDLFLPYELSIQDINQVFLRSDIPEATAPHNDGDDLLTDFVTTDSVVAIAADHNSLDTFWFVKISDNSCTANGNEIDDYGNIIADRSKYIKGQFLEFLHENNSKKNYKLSNKVIFFYKESILYPFVNIN